MYGFKLADLVPTTLSVRAGSSAPSSGSSYRASVVTGRGTVSTDDRLLTVAGVYPVTSTIRPTITGSVWSAWPMRLPACSCALTSTPGAVASTSSGPHSGGKSPGYLTTSTLTLREPDNIQLEPFAPRPSTT